MSKHTLDIPKQLFLRASELVKWNQGKKESPTSDEVEIELLRALERGLLESEIDHWRIRQPNELRDDFAWLTEEHEHWLGAFDDVYRERFVRLLHAAPESAIWESTVRRLLEPEVAYVYPNEDPVSGSGADFRCQDVNRKKFYVDAKCVRIEVASFQSGMRDDLSGGYYEFLTKALVNAVKSKARQASNADDAPFLIFAGTLHRSASMACLRKRGAQFAGSLGFKKSSPSGAALPARASVAGIVICGAGALARDLWISEDHPNAFGILNPHANRPFDPSLLPYVPFIDTGN